jgi:phage baseplate assembly protein gpV
MSTTEPLPTIQKYRTGQIDLETATLRVALFDDTIAYSPDRVNHEFVSDVLDGATANELDDASYSRQDVLNAAVTVGSGDTEVVVDADDVTFSSLSGGETIQGWLLYAQIGGDDTTPGDDPIVAIGDEVLNSAGDPVTTNGSDVTLAFNAEGIFTVVSQ